LAGLFAHARRHRPELAQLTDAAGIKAQEEPSPRDPLLAQGYDPPTEGGDGFAKSIAADIHCRGYGALGDACQINQL
jgi:hypothetical protein